MPSEYSPRIERHCDPCEFHKCFSVLYGQPGNTWRDYNCTHPDAFGPLKLSDNPDTAFKQGEMRAELKKHGRHIGRTERQPDWCPLRNESINPIKTKGGV